MHRLIVYIVVPVFFLICTNTSAQENYKTVDSTTYSLYINKNWTELINYGEKAVSSGYDYFYLNLRMGIAYFNLHDYKTSKFYLEKANKSNSFDKVVIEYLFWNNYHLLKEKETLLWYGQLDDTIKKRINYTPLKKLNSIYIEAGQKFSNNNSIAENVSYFNLAFKHHLSGRINLAHSYTFSKQNLNWGSFQQHQYYINPSYLINKTLKFNLALHGAQYASKLDYSVDYTVESSGTISKDTTIPNQFPWLPPTTTTIYTTIDSSRKARYFVNGAYQESDILIQPRITKEWKWFTIAGYASYYYSSSSPSYAEYFNDTLTITETTGNNVLINENTEISDSTSAPAKNNRSQYGIGTNFYFNYKKITFGADVKYIIAGNSNTFFFSPFLKVDFGKKVHLSTYFFNKKGYVIGLFEGAQLINSYDDIRKFNLTASFNASKKLVFYLTYQNESIFDKLNLQNYQLNSVYFGVKLKL